MAEAYIQGLKDSNGNIIYPKSKNEAIYNSKGVPLSEQHFVIQGPIEFTGTNYTIQDNRIRANAIANIYYNDNYDMQPSYTVAKGAISISLDEFPSGVNKIIIDAVEVVNL